MSKLKNALTQIVNNVKAVPYMLPLILIMSCSPPMNGTMEDFRWSLFSGIFCLTFFSVFVTVHSSRAKHVNNGQTNRPLQIQPLPEQVGPVSYALSIFIFAFLSASLMAFLFGLGWKLFGLPLDWPLLWELMLLKNIILAGPVALWGWKVLSKLSAPTSIETRKLPTP